MLTRSGSNPTIPTATRCYTNPTNQEWDVERYQSHYSFVYQYGRSLLTELVDASSEQTILDIGCGTGELTAELFAWTNATIIGMDADHSMITRAKKMHPNITFRIGDMRDFHVEEPVDVVFSNAALHWIPKIHIDQAVSCMADTMKQGGRFIVEFGGTGNVHTIITACQDVLWDRHQYDFECPWYFPSIAEFSTLLEKHGIEVLSAELFDRPTVLEDGEHGLSNWIRMFAGQFFAEYLDEAFLTAVNDKLYADMFDGKQWTADYRRIRITGRKL